MRIYTIGFTKKTAQRFFDLVAGSNAERLVDVRLHNSSQLAGFAKQDDLAFFLARLCNVEYIAEPLLAPEAAMLSAYRAKRMRWDEYARLFIQLMRDRRIEAVIPRELIDGAVLLCSEDDPERCHRRLAAEYLADSWGGSQIIHLR